MGKIIEHTPAAEFDVVARARLFTDEHGAPLLFAAQIGEVEADGYTATLVQGVGGGLVFQVRATAKDGRRVDIEIDARPILVQACDMVGVAFDEGLGTVRR